MALTVGTNSYIDVAGAEEYFSTRLNADAWTSAALTLEKKEAALVTATRDIDLQRLKGYKTDPDQALEFPRDGETAIPEKVKLATCEQALYLLEQTAWDRERERLKAAGVTSKNVGGASESFSGNPNFLAPLALEYLRKYLVTVGRLV